MSSNFDFCYKYWPDLTAYGKLAEKYLYTDPNACIIKVGIMSENILSKIFEYEKIAKPEVSTALNLTKILKEEGLLPKNVEDCLYIIRKSRNSAVHSNLDSLDEAKKQLRTIFYLLNWFMVVYGDWQYKPKAFVLPEKEDSKEEVKEIEQLEEETTELSQKEEPSVTLASEIPAEKRAEIGKEVSDTIVKLDPEDQKIVAEEKIRLEANVVPVINYAMSQNDIKIISSVYLKNNTSSEIENIVIKVESVPEFIVPYTHNVSYIRENSDITINDLKLHVNVDYLVNLTEKESGHITVKVLSDDKELNSEVYDISLLAYDQWNGMSIYPEILCSFVTPNHPLIGKIISEATELLDKWTKNPSMDAYQSGDKNRVRLQAAALFGSIQKLQIAYSESPASYGKGQRVRLCETLIQQKIGNCLDLTLLYAACLEAIGLNPLLIIKESHAFIGYWLVNCTLPEVISDDVSIITKRIAEGVNDLRVVECTSMCYRSNISYEKAEELAQKELMEHDFQCVMDVKCARLNKIIPISARVVKDNGWTVERNETTSNDITTAPSILDFYSEEEQVKKEPKEYTKQEQWERKLLDLGLRNRLINMHLNSSIIPILSTSVAELENRLADKENFRLFCKPTEYQTSEEKDDFEALTDLGGYKQFVQSELENGVLHTPLTDGELLRAVKNLSRKARESLEENGANSLFLAIGVLKWCEQRRITNPHYAPIILLPVNISKKASSMVYEIELRDEDPQINISLLEKLSQDFDLDIDGLDSLPEDSYGLDISKILATVRKGIMNQKYWNVLECACLGIFSFSSFVMWNDLHSRYDDISKNKIVKSLVDQRIVWDPSAEEDDKAETYLPISLDASQIAAVKEATKGKSFILHGPPGTGKSQTITALIANALGNGKKVLFVAEKRAALEVVQDRLAKIGLAPFCLEMHSNKASKTAVLDHLREAEEVRKRKTSQGFEAKLVQLNKIKEELDEYAKELHTPQENGMSLYDAINNYSSNASFPNLKGMRFTDPEKTSFEQLENDYSVIQNLVSAGRKVGHPHNHPLSRVALDQYTPQLREDIERQCSAYENSIYDFFDDVDGFAQKISYGEVYDYDKCLEVLDIAEQLSKFKNIPEQWAQTKNPRDYFNKLKELCDKEIQADEKKNNILKYFNEKLFDFDVRNLDFTKLFDGSLSSLSDLDDIYKKLAQSYKSKMYSTFDILRCKIEDLFFLDDETKSKIDLIDTLLHTMNELGSINESPLKNVGKKDNFYLSKQLMSRTVSSYKTMLEELNNNLDEFSSIIGRSNDDLNSLVEIANLLKQWEKIPRAFAKEKNLSIYLSNIETMAKAAIDSAKIKALLEEKWNIQFFELNSEELFDEYNRIETSGLFNKVFELANLRKRLKVYFKGELDKDEIKNELLQFVAYQKEQKTFDTLFQQYGNDLGYLYEGSKTNWQFIIDFVRSVLEKGKVIDETLKGDEIRCNYAGDEKMIPLIDSLINSFEIAKEKKVEFDRVLTIKDVDEQNWVKDDLRVCSVIMDKSDYVDNWIKYNSLCSDAQKLGIEEAVYNALEKENDTLFSKYEVKKLLSELKKYQELSDENDLILKDYQEGLIHYYPNDDIDWFKIKEITSNIERMEEKVDAKETYKNIRTTCAGKEELNEHFESLVYHKKEYEDNQKIFYELLKVKPLSDSDWYEDEKELCGNIIDQIDNLRDWTIFNKAVEQANEANLNVVVDNYIDGIDHDDLLNAYMKAYFKALTETIISKSLVLSNFSGGVFEDKVRRFKELDEEIKETNQKLIFNNIVKNIPNFEKEATKSNEVALLNRAIQNKGRGRSLRSLFSQLPTLITRICPCVLMSPLSVAQYLDPNTELFDLIVFDEASQLQTSKAVGAIARAKNAIIVGDPKQMPPTNFFMSNTYDEDHEDIEDLESILDDCMAIKMASKHLSWHYRSTHESLIAFSNSRFYENKLYTFPSYNDRESKVKFVKTKGIFDRGRKRTNLIEAKAIVDEIIRRSNDPKLMEDSIGVVTFNSNQQDLIEDLIADQCAKSKRFNAWVNREEDKALFVKNLENIQGDERDVILFSVCYGPDDKGKISMNFGPLNKEGGWRRLNVAISRARKEMVVFTSLVPEQITYTKSEGVSALRDFLEFARSGRLNLENVEANKDKYYSSGILDSVCSELLKEGYRCEKLIGHSDYRIDIGVIDPNNPDQYLLGILIDGPNYQIAENTRDREVAQTAILNKLGWNIYRLWSLDWWNDKGGVIASIEMMLKKALKQKETGIKEVTDDKLIVEKEVKEDVVKQESLNRVKKTTYEKKPKPEKSLFEKLKDLGLEVIVNISSSGIVWVIYDEQKATEVENLLKQSKLRFALERRGAVATGGRKAYRIMMGGK